MRLDKASSAPKPFWVRLGWFVLIWALSIAVLGVVAYLLRFWLGLGR